MTRNLVQRAAPPPRAGLCPATQEYRGSEPWAPRRQCAPWCDAGSPPAAPAAPTASWAAPRRAPRRGRRAPAREEEQSPGTRPCTSSHVPPPWPWQSSGPVVRCGATLLPGPSGRSSVHTANMHGGVAPAAAWRLPGRGQHQACQPLKPFSCKKHTQHSGISCGKTACVVVVVVVSETTEARQCVYPQSPD